MPVNQISKIKVRSGLKDQIPQLATGEFGWAIDTQELYIGNGNVSNGAPIAGNTQIYPPNGNTGNGGTEYVINNTYNNTIVNFSNTYESGVNTINNLQGNITLIGGNGISIVNDGTEIIISNSGGGSNSSGNCGCGCPEIVTANAVTLSTENHTILLDCSANAATVLLPSVSSGDASNGQLFYIKKIDSSGNPATILASGSDTIEGSSSLTLANQYDYAVLQNDCISEWYIYASLFI